MDKSDFKVGDIVKYVGHNNTGSGTHGFITKIKNHAVFVVWFYKFVEKKEMPVSCEFIQKVS